MTRVSFGRFYYALNKESMPSIMIGIQMRRMHKSEGETRWTHSYENEDDESD